jgi:hypothetical protein
MQANILKGLWHEIILTRRAARLAQLTQQKRSCVAAGGAGGGARWQGMWSARFWGMVVYEGGEGGLPGFALMQSFRDFCALGDRQNFLGSVMHLKFDGNRIGSLYRARICKRLRSPRVDSEESISSAYVAWRVSTTNRVFVPARQAGNRFLGSLKGLQIRAQYCTCWWL